MIFNTHFYNRIRQVGSLSVLFLLIISAITLFTTSSCVSMYDPEESQEYRAHIVGTVTPETAIGQSFVSRRQPLSAIQIWYQINKETAPANGKLKVSLFHSISDDVPLEQISIDFNNLINKSSYTIPIKYRTDPVNQTYYIEFQVNHGEFLVYGRSEDAYYNGQAYINGVEIDSDIAFRLSYTYNESAILQDIVNIVRNTGYLLLTFIAILLPGGILVNILPIKSEHDRFLKIGLASGISLAIVPVFMLWTSKFNIRLESWIIRWIFVLLSVIYLYQNRHSILIFFRKTTPSINRRLLTDIAMAAIIIAALFIRFAMIRDLAAPAWVDSVHHALITNLIVENGGYPDNYSPLPEISTHNYHPGYHSLIAVFMWLANRDITYSMLIIGQVLNTLCVIAVYLLAKSMTNNRLAAIIAGLITGFITPMPAYYTSWGRYTQLTGLLILPTAYYLTLRCWKTVNVHENIGSYITKKSNFSLTIITVLTYSGIFLTHYRASAYLACLLISFFLVQLFLSRNKPKLRRKTIQFPILIILITSSALLITWEWWPSLISSLLIPRVVTIVSSQPRFFDDFSWGYLTPVYGNIAMVLAILGCILGLIRKKSFPYLIIIWVLLLFLLANINALGFPGAKLINNTSVTIALFIPISILSGYLIAIIILLGRKPLVGWPKKLYQLVISMSLVFVMIMGARKIIPIINPTTVLFRQPDYEALDWIQNNIPTDEIIAINPFAWGFGMYAGDDGGYWISPLTKHLSIPPPALYGLSPTLSRFVAQTSRKLISSSDDVDDLYLYLKENNINYIFIGTKGGVLSPKMFNDSPLFNTIFNSRESWMFQLEQ